MNQNYMKYLLRTPNYRRKSITFIGDILLMAVTILKYMDPVSIALD